MSTHSQRPLKVPGPGPEPGPGDDPTGATAVPEDTRDHTRDESADETRDNTPDVTHEGAHDELTNPGPTYGDGPTVVRGDDAETRVVGLPRVETGSSMFPERTTSAVDPYIGKVVSSRYRVLSKLGEGGMGTVYLAEHVVIERKVALKVLSTDFARKPELVARFMQEAKAASRIGHENIVDVTDFGQTEAGSVFFAMEHLQGADLATVIRSQEQLPFARARSIVVQICNALTAAHSKGIIHRDMKPENVFLVERDGNPDFVKVLDFGIAKMSANDEAGDRLTRTGMIFGTPEYMSPEQARGERPDNRVDIYAVGCMLYEMLTGDVPFYAETFMGVLTKHMFEPPDPLHVRVPDGHFSPEVEGIVMRALAKNREERFQSTRELALALSACDEMSLGTAAAGSTQVPRPRASSRTSSRAPSTPPMMVAAAHPETTAFPARIEEPTKAPWALIAALGAAAVALSVGGWVLLHKRPIEAPPTAVVVPTPVVTPTTHVPGGTPPTPATPAMSEHSIKLGSSIPVPRGQSTPGQVWNGPELVGTVPGLIRMKHSEHEVKLRCTWPGYKDYWLTVLPDADRTYTPTYEILQKRNLGGKTNSARPPIGNTLHPVQPNKP